MDQSLTNHLARIKLAFLPTPLEEMSRLREALGGGPRLLIKRDDQTGLATGGNKTRKLEFVVADALARNADTLVTTGAAQSNHCRQTAAAAARLGLRCVLILSGQAIPKQAWRGNLLLNELLGAKVRWCGEQMPEDVMAETMAALKAEGSSPYEIPKGASVPLGAAGYVAAVEEVAEQLQAQNIEIDRIVFPSGSAGTHTGILLGVKALGLKASVEGICDDANAAELLEKVKQLTADTKQLLNLDVNLTDNDFIMHGKYGRPGYGVITQAEKEAIRLLARTEGIVTDPVYTGRALVGLIDMIRQGIYAKNETILYWHTGGVAGLFPRAAEMLA